MKYLWLTPNFFQYTAMTLAPRAIGYKVLLIQKHKDFPVLYVMGSIKVLIELRNLRVLWNP
ncbi:MAG: hypothetical protein P8N57_03140 [Flavobacteriaceae bacterium]|nr:hypothetical protein [Flavobacteriaceae bacterium]